MPTISNLKALGLSLSTNPLEVMPGSMTEASNIVIRRNDVVESRRGYKIYDSGFGSSTDRAKQLLVYKQRILTHYGNTLAYDTGVKDVTSGLALYANFAGSFTEPQAGLRIKSIEANGNLYFTSSNGIQKISATSNTEFTSNSGYVTAAGGAKAVDFTATPIYSAGNQTNFMTADSAVSYRIVWATKDKNHNLILGTPSQRAEITNPLLPILIQDYTRLLAALDNVSNAGGSLISDGTYMTYKRIPINLTAVDLRNYLIQVVTELDGDILYANGTGTGAPLAITAAPTISSGVCTVTFSAGTATNYFSSGSKIYLSGFTPTSGTLNGAQTVSSVTATTITFTTSATGTVTISSPTIADNTYRSITQPGVPSLPTTNAQLVGIQTYLQSIITQLQSENSNVISPSSMTNYITPLAVTTASSVQLNITIPKSVTSNHFLQIYRTAVAPATGTQVLATDVASGDEMQQVYEAYPTAAQLAATTMTVVDNTPDGFRGANLYTNAQSGEGILQANDIPPLAKDINVFKNVTFYANTQTKQNKLINLLGVTNMVSDYNLGKIPKVTIATSAGGFNTYTFTKGVQQVSSITCNADVSNSLDGKYFTFYSANNQTAYYAWFKTVSGVDPALSGKTGIQVNLATNDSAINVATKLANAISLYPVDFTASNQGASSNVVTLTNNNYGYTKAIADVNTGFTFATTTSGAGERIQQQITNVTTVADVAGSLAGKYFTINTAYDQAQYYIWYTVGGSGADPSITNKVGINVALATNDSAATVASKTQAVLNTLSDLSVSVASNILTITGVAFGPTDAGAVGTSGFTVAVSQLGALEVLLSAAVSPAQAVDSTARSLIRVINQNKTESVYGYYLSGATDVPGKLYLEARDLSTPNFYIVGNDSNTGKSFNPDISPTLTISSITTGNPGTMTVTTTTPHGLQNLDYVLINSSNSDSSIDGYRQITYVSSTQFRVNEYVTVSGNAGVAIPVSIAVTSENANKPNRVYYSKLQQPESVPAVNYFDIGANDKAVLRIFPLRDTLFIFKEDGLYRISGEVAPFTLALFDSSCIVVAPDSVSVANNNIYAWTTQGISIISESGVETISRQIDTEILKVASSGYTSFKTATWGMGYDSDNSYIVYTLKNPTDTAPTIAYRYSNLTKSWTTFNQSKLCGVVNSADDKVYLGAADLNSTEQERKAFTREDYADREHIFSLTDNNYFGSRLKLLTTNNITAGDSLTQLQTVTIYTYNSLLQKLDLDPGLALKNYTSSLTIAPGANMRTALLNLAAKLDSDANLTNHTSTSTITTKSGSITSVTANNPCVITSTGHGLITGRTVQISGCNASPSINGQYTVTVIDANTFSIPASVISVGTAGSFTTVDGDFSDMQACYNYMINTVLNGANGTSFTNYLPVNNTTLIEASITSVNTSTNYVTLNLALPFIVGNIKTYEAIQAKFTYAPNHLQDPSTFKHFRELTVMFLNKAFTSATVRVASDLLPQLVPIPFNGDGNGIFGYAPFGSGFFGGGSHAAPFRTYVPRQCQRARYLVIQFEHTVAREQFGITGMTLTGEAYSTRAYR